MKKTQEEIIKNTYRAAKRKRMVRKKELTSYYQLVSFFEESINQGKKSVAINELEKVAVPIEKKEVPSEKSKIYNAIAEIKGTFTTLIYKGPRFLDTF